MIHINNNITQNKNCTFQTGADYYHSRTRVRHSAAHFVQHHAGRLNAVNGVGQPRRHAGINGLQPHALLEESVAVEQRKERGIGVNAQQVVKVSGVGGGERIAVEERKNNKK